MKITFDIQNEKIKEKISMIREKCENFTDLFNTWILDFDLEQIIID